MLSPEIGARRKPSHRLSRRDKVASCQRLATALNPPLARCLSFGSLAIGIGTAFAS
jgi:hypothetical protein